MPKRSVSRSKSRRKKGKTKRHDDDNARKEKKSSSQNQNKDHKIPQFPNHALTDSPKRKVFNSLASSPAARESPPRSPRSRGRSRTPKRKKDKRSPSRLPCWTSKGTTSSVQFGRRGNKERVRKIMVYFFVVLVEIVEFSLLKTAPARFPQGF
jgi:hypothetical protein